MRLQLQRTVPAGLRWGGGHWRLSGLVLHSRSARQGCTQNWPLPERLKDERHSCSAAAIGPGNKGYQKLKVVG